MPDAAAGPVEPLNCATVTVLSVRLNEEVYVVAEATPVEYDVVCVIPAFADIFSPSWKDPSSPSVPVLIYFKYKVD